MPLQSDYKTFMLHSQTRKQLEKIVQERAGKKQGEWVFITVTFLIVSALLACLCLATVKTSGTVGYSSYWLGIITGAAIVAAVVVFLVSGQRLIRIQRQIRYISKHPSKYAMRRGLAGVFRVTDIDPRQAGWSKPHDCHDCLAAKKCQLALKQLYDLQRSYIEAGKQPPAEITDVYLEAFYQARELNNNPTAARRISEHQLHLALAELTSKIQRALASKQCQGSLGQSQ